MKLKAIAAVCKAYKNIIVLNGENGEQWLTNGYGIYKLSGLPTVDAAGMLTIFDVPDDKRGEWYAKDDPLPTGSFCFTDDCDGEKWIEMLPIRTIHADKTHCYFDDGDRIYVINEEFLKPLMPFGEFTRFYKRTTAKGEFSLAIKNGLLIEALLLPADIWSRGDFVDAFERIARGGYDEIKRAAERKAAKDAERAAKAAENLDEQETDDE